MNAGKPYWINWTNEALNRLIKHCNEEINELNDDRSYCPDENNLALWDRMYGGNIANRIKDIQEIQTELKRRQIERNNQ